MVADEANETQDVGQESIPSAGDGGDMGKKLEKAGWGLVLIWVGIALLWDPGWGVFLVGLGVIALARQVAGACFALKLERFWVVAGGVLVVVGVLTHFRPDIQLVPIALIVVGAVSLISILTGKCGCGTKGDDSSCCSD